ncbi:Calcium/calmodulin-dependent/calcium-dependent protein kinase [Drechmeria coniospora]|uniref:Calcium/calmodulin-dependent/calcium-dependent protein kinase n=1 Tax=Drechmeria coniospora TaxID=98403 RepID=A0A151GK07_DRECN|nr:Calcium/calmodulin-dependent/calcium-dependent protein kinase [Drechmeria coniospora]KYK57453.1 Calcium/calmodulin-dependent/calcium-dependent protein kinase [Drechmeria coniospora]
MSTIQQLKNFIRHGKQARVANHNDEPQRKNDHIPPHAPQPPLDKRAHNVSEPARGHNPPPPKEPLDAFSAAARSPQNKAAQAAHVAAHHVEAGQDVKKSKRVVESEIKQLVAEENASKSKFSQYPGLDRWELLEKMGDGAFSNVYRARDREGDRGEVAIKVVRKYEMNSMQRSNILKEVQIMRQLDHPNIIKLVDFTESKQYYYIVLELAPGGELFHQIVRLTYFSEELSRHVIVKVAKALEYLHEERGVVHRYSRPSRPTPPFSPCPWALLRRPNGTTLADQAWHDPCSDIKPENILYTPIPVVPSKSPKPRQPGDEDKVDEGEFVHGVGAGGIGEIKIADFGLSKIVWESQTMTPCGTVGYTAPEIVKDERYSKSVDMWALGCVLYTLLCGFPPFYDESIEVLTEKVAKGQFTFLSPWWDDISTSAKDLISHLLCVDPDKRYTIRQFLAHPWILASGPSPREERRKPGVLRAFDANQLDENGKHYDFRSPGAVNLREVFDVSYAVHRQEEEGKRRQQIGAKAGPGFPLAGLDEEEEDEDQMQIDQGAGYKPQYATQSLEQSMRQAHIQDPAQAHGREPNRANEKGYGQHSATVTAAARQQVRDRNRQKGAFELNLDNATLLGKRGKKVPVAGA